MVALCRAASAARGPQSRFGRQLAVPSSVAPSSSSQAPPNGQLSPIGACNALGADQSVRSETRRCVAADGVVLSAQSYVARVSIESFSFNPFFLSPFHTQPTSITKPDFTFQCVWPLMPPSHHGPTQEARFQSSGKCSHIHRRYIVIFCDVLLLYFFLFIMHGS